MTDPLAQCSVPCMSLRDYLDQNASLVRTLEIDPYEAAVAVASAADRCAHDGPSSETEAAVALREVFGSWVARIEAYGTADGDVEAADEAGDLIVSALTEWGEGGVGNDLTAFAEKWRSQVGQVDTSWLDVPATPLTRASWIRTLFRGRARR